MKYFLPRMMIAVLCPEQDRLRSKIGGVPWGLDAELWPTCCGVPQKLLAQLCHEPPMLDLGRDGSVLHLFQCLECGGLGDDGSRAAFITKASDLGHGLTTIPDYDHKPDLGERLIGEVWIDGWDERDDGIPANRLPDFFAWDSWYPLEEEFPNTNRFNGRESTRFGGPPSWTGNGPMGFPPPPFEFLLQLGSGLYFEGTLPEPDEVGCPIHTSLYENGRGSHLSTVKPHQDKVRLNSPWHIAKELSESGYWIEYTNLGTDGIAYVFIDRSRQPHEVRWSWHR